MRCSASETPTRAPADLKYPKTPRRAVTTAVIALLHWFVNRQVAGQGKLAPRLRVSSSRKLSTLAAHHPELEVRVELADDQRIDL